MTDFSSSIASRPLGIRRGLAWTTYAYAALVLLDLCLIRWGDDGSWVVVILLFLPRWLFLFPLIALGVASVRARLPALGMVQAVTGVVIAGPLMGLSLPVGEIGSREPSGERFRILTYNRGEDALDTRRLLAMIERERIDLICFQEGHPDDLVLDAFFSRGWYRDRTRRLASRYPIVAEGDPLPDEWHSEERYPALLARARVRTPSGTEFVLASVHLPTLRPGFNRVFAGNVGGLKLHIQWWRHELGRVMTRLIDPAGAPVLAAGDFNMPADSSTMTGLRSFYRFGFEEAGWGYGYTRPTRCPWFRIDHLLASPECRVTRCWVGPDFGSDHLPLLAEVVLPASPRARPRNQ